MKTKFVLLLVAVMAGCNAFPTPDEEQDMSIFFEHVDPNERIVGGTVAANGGHPSIGALTNGLSVSSFLCGSSIITRRTILTAAHCIRAVVSGNTLSTSLRIRVGSNRWNSGGQVYPFQRFLVHPEYNANLIKSDLGFLYTTNIIMNNLVRAIPINYTWVGARVHAVVAGWGRMSAGGAISPSLMQLIVTTVDGIACTNNVPIVAAQNNIRNPPPVLPPIEICAFNARNRGTCNGDSGSPLERIDNGQQIGLVSWGLPCALGAPDMFVRLSAYRAWIQSNTLH